MRQVREPGDDIRIVDRQRPRDETRVEIPGGRRAHVDHHRVLVPRHQPAQFVGGDAGDAKHLVEATPLPPFDSDIRGEQREDDRDRRGPDILQALDELGDLLMEDHPGADRDSGPERSSHAVPQEKSGPAEVHRAGERRADGGQAGKEFRHGQHEAAPALEGVFGLAHARIGRKRNAAKELHDAIAIEPAGHEPDSVANHAGHERDREHRPRGKLSVHGQSARDDERGNRGQRRSKLLRQHVREYEYQSIMRDEGNELVHGLDYCHFSQGVHAE